MEGWANFLSWLHADMGYTFDELRERTWPEVNALQLGWHVRQERQSGTTASGAVGGSYSDRRKRQHKQHIYQQLKAN